MDDVVDTALPATAPASLAPPITLVIEDDLHQREAIVTYLNLEGLVADGVGSLRLAERWLLTHRLDILVVDLGLPDGDGLEWLAGRPDLGDKGIIVTTARGRPEDRVKGVKAGVDSYLVKPVNLEELAGVIANLHRRLQRDAPTQSWSLNQLNWGLKSPDGTTVQLTRSETRVLSVLAKFGGAGAPRDALIEGLGKNPDSYDWRRMEVLVRRLRSKVKADTGLELPLRTVHGYGYAFTELLLVAP